MACAITFMSPGEHPLLLHVEQSADELAAKMGEGKPFEVNESNTGMRVHVNPSAVAYWKDHPRPASP